MPERFEGRKIRDGILADLKARVGSLGVKPVISVIWIGDDPVLARYVEQKQRAAEFLGVHFDIIKFSNSATEPIVLEKINQLNNDNSVHGIMLQLPVPENLNREKLIAEILTEKDVDGLRFCQNLDSDYLPPVVLAIMEAIQNSGIDFKTKKIALIGQGFLVGSPLIKYLDGVDLRIADENTPYIGTITSDADIVISAVGKPGLIKVEMVKDGVVLIDAGTTELGGKLIGDVDSKAYAKASFYTPVPGGIGPVTVAMLYKNLISKFK